MVFWIISVCFVILGLHRHKPLVVVDILVFVIRGLTYLKKAEQIRSLDMLVAEDVGTARALILEADIRDRQIMRDDLTPHHFLAAIQV